MDKVGRSILRNCRDRFTKLRFFLGLFLIFTMELVMCNGIFDFMKDIQMPITFWMAPHLFSNHLFVAYFGFILCYMFADVPFMNRSELYWVLREGRSCWLLGKMGMIVVESLLIAVWSLLCGALVFFPRLTFDWDWGKIIYTLAYSQEVMDQYLEIFTITSSTLIERYTPAQAMVLCMGMITMISSLIGFCMFLLSLYTKRFVAVGFGLMCSSVHYALGSIPQLMQLFYISPLTWLMIGKQGQKAFAIKRYPSLSYCLIAGFVVIVVSVVLILVRKKHLEYVWYKEE